MAAAEQMSSPQYVCASRLSYAQLLLTAGDARSAERALSLVASSTALADRHGMYGFQRIANLLLERSQRRRTRSA
jgi:hypothetical protein